MLQLKRWIRIYKEEKEEEDFSEAWQRKDGKWYDRVNGKVVQVDEPTNKKVPKSDEDKSKSKDSLEKRKKLEKEYHDLLKQYTKRKSLNSFEKEIDDKDEAYEKYLAQTTPMQKKLEKVRDAFIDTYSKQKKAYIKKHGAYTLPWEEKD